MKLVSPIENIQGDIKYMKPFPYLCLTIEKNNLYESIPFSKSKTKLRELWLLPFLSQFQIGEEASLFSKKTKLGEIWLLPFLSQFQYILVSKKTKLEEIWRSSFLSQFQIGEKASQYILVSKKTKFEEIWLLPLLSQFQIGEKTFQYISPQIDSKEKNLSDKPHSENVGIKALLKEEFLNSVSVEDFSLQIASGNMQQESANRKRIQVFIKTSNGTLVHSLHDDSKIKVLKMFVMDREGIPIEEQRLVFQKYNLDDDKSLSFYEIQDQSTIFLKMRVSGGGKIYFTIFNKIHNFNLPNNSLVKDLKEKLAVKYSIDQENISMNITKISFSTK